MHDTNFKNAFLSARRYFSHGCIRLARPLELGNCLTANKIDSDFVKACVKGQEPVSIKTQITTPVFVIYQTVIADDDSVKYLDDIYHHYR